MAPQDRKDVMQKFRAGQTRVLISTNVLARGIDVSQVTHVINFDLPMEMGSADEPRQERKVDYAAYLHRVGRTARFGKKGVALNMLKGEFDEKYMRSICNYFKVEVPMIKKEDIKTKLQV